MSDWQSEYDRQNYTDPRLEMAARLKKAMEIGDGYVALPTVLVSAVLDLRECESKTIINGNPIKRTLIEIKCERLVGAGGEHSGMHRNGRNNW